MGIKLWTNNHPMGKSAANIRLSKSELCMTKEIGEKKDTDNI